jgi:hypothetical protein
MGQPTVWVYKQEKLSVESFHITLMTGMELVSETPDFILHLTWLSAREDFIGKFYLRDFRFSERFC